MRRGYQPLRLFQRRLADGRQIQQSGELFGEMLDQMDFAVEIQDL